MGEPQYLSAHPPPPECWGWELEYLIGRLNDRLDIWKAYGCLLISLDVAHLLPKRSSQFKRCLSFGSHQLGAILRKRFTCDVDQPLSEFQTPTLTAMTQACCLDDINLNHVFDLLRMTELLENCNVALTFGHHAQILLAVIGELELVANDLGQGLGGSSTDTKSSKLKCAALLRATQKQLLDLVCESGRDRATHLKDMFSRIPFSGPRPRFCDASSLSAVRSDSALPNAMSPSTLSMYALSAAGDPALQNLLLSGSLMSMWHRLHSLWRTIDPTRRTRNPTLQESMVDEIVRSSSVADRIRWAVFHSVKQMSRYRRLLFTRLLEALCSPIFISPPSHLTSQAVGSTHSPEALVRLVVEAFLDARISLWPYESESQLRAIDLCPLLSEDIKRQLKSVICVPDWIVFCTEQEDLEQDNHEWVPSIGVTSETALTCRLPGRVFSDPFQTQVNRQKFDQAVKKRFEERMNWEREQIQNQV